MNLFWVGVVLWSIIAIGGGAIFFYISFKRAEVRLDEKNKDLSYDEQIDEFIALRKEHMKQYGIFVGGSIGMVLGSMIFISLIFSIFDLLLGSCYSMFNGL